MFERITARRIALLLAAAALAMTAAACGDDEDDASSSAESAAAEVSSAVDSAASQAESVASEASSDVESAMSEATSEAGEATADTAAVGGAPTVTADLGSLSGKVAIDGSSTVEPITSAVAEEFSKEAGDVEVTVGTSGTGGGFEKFCNGETDISNASRPIEDDETTACADKGIEFVELEIAKDALTVAVNIDNDWATCLTTEQLKTIWNEGSTVAQVERGQPRLPGRVDSTLYGPDTDSGTFDYFTAAINGEEGVSRSDYTASEDDNVLVQGVSGDKGGLGYFGFAYFEENQSTLKALEVDGGAGCVAPSPETVLDGTYTPLSRPLYIYVSKAAAARPEVAAFVNYYLENGAALVEEVRTSRSRAEKYAEDAATFASFAGS